MKEIKMNSMLRTLIVLTLAFAFAFAPFAADKASAGTKIIDETFSSEQIVQKFGETVFCREYFTLENDSITYNVNAIASVTAGTAITTEDLQITVIEQNSDTVIEPDSDGVWKVNQPGWYVVKVVAPAGLDFPTSPIPRVTVEGIVSVETEALPEYGFFEVEKSSVQGKYAEDLQFTIYAGAANYTGYSDLGRLFYLKDHYTGKFMYMGELTSVATKESRVSVTADRGKKYTVYVVNRNIAEDNKSDVPLPIGGTGGTTSDVFKLTKDQQAKLKEISQSKTISTPAPAIGKITKLTNKKGVTVATLTWTVAKKANGKAPNITGYYVKRYNTSGKLLKTTKVTKLKDKFGDYRFNVTEDFYTPYKGKSVYKITPYFKYLGKEYKGKTKPITVQSKELGTGTDGNTVKITNDKISALVWNEYGSDGVAVFEKKNGKWVQIANTKKAVKAGKGYQYFTISKKGIGKKTLKFKSYVVDGGKTYWSPVSKKSFTPRKNQVTIGTSDNIGAYPWLEVTKVRTKIWYEGNDMKVKYRVVNRDSRKTISVQTTVTVENPLTGKFTTVGRSNKKSVTLDYGQMKFVTVTIKNAKKVDLLNQTVR